MNYKSNLKRIWSVVAVLSLFLLALMWFGYESQNLKYAILTLNALMFLLSLPCSIFAVPVIIASAHFLEMSPLASEGIYLSSILLLMLGFLQWFWIANFWSPSEPVMQKLNLVEARVK